MKFVFRNNTLEPFFPKGYSFSGYDDISFIPEDAEEYVWFYQAPVHANVEANCNEITAIPQKLEYVLERIPEGKSVIALTMDVLYQVPLTEDDARLEEAVYSYNSFLWDAGRKRQNLKVIDFSEFTRMYPRADLMDWRFYLISQMGLNPKIAKDFQTWWNRKIESVALRRKKCLVLDLDNTLWGGVLGEDGVGGIKIGGDYPGKAFLFFQEALLELSKSGVILAICSKNNESDVDEVWEKNPFMILKKGHFSASRINWDDKATNIKELAKELNIGLDSLVFVDDNPAERELIRQMLPMVAVPEFPAQPYGLPDFFKSLVDNYFKVYSLTEEDKNKAAQYKANAERAKAQESFSDFGAFLESLDIRLTIQQANEFNIPRIAQMTQKTNQFNLTTRRYTDSDVKAFLASGWKIWCLSVADRFGDNGITGAIMVNGDEIDSLLLSCRILGKGIEGAFVKSVLSILKEQGLKTLRACYVPTAKNSQVHDFYDRCGFTPYSVEDEVKKYEINLECADLQIEKYYHLNIQ